MKKITLLLGAIITASVGFSQIIFDVQSSSCSNLLGTWNHTMADTDGSATDWGQTTDMFVAANAITAELALVDDGTTPGQDDTGGNSPHPTIEDACDSSTWTQDLTGKIAVAFRGACEFGLKTLNAEKRGAIALVLINHSGDPIGMAGGSFGAQSTIPVIMLSETDGNQFADCLRNGGTMTAFLGSKVGLFPNDMASSPADIVMTEGSTIPMTLSNAAQTDIPLGLWAYNFGQNDAIGVTGTVDVMYMGNSVYTNTSAPMDFNAPDTSFVDTQYIDLGTFMNAAGTLTGGKYSVTYTINFPSDDAMADNTFMFDFWVTDDNTYAKARLDAQGAPIHTTAFSLNESTTQYDDFETCIQFSHPNASSLSAMDMTFSCEPVGGTMANEIVEVRAYSWDDVFTDANDPNFPTAGGPGPWTLTQLSSALHFYIDESQDGVNITLPFDAAPVALADNQRYLFCVYNASDSLRIGFDAQIDYNSTINQYLEYSSPVKTLANGGSDEWYAVGFGTDVTTAVSVNLDETPTAVAEEASNVAAPAYPNPANSILNVPVRRNVSGNVAIQVMDVTGKVVLSANEVIGAGPLQLNVASIANGSYVFKLTFADGSTDTFKVSVNR